MFKYLAATDLVAARSSTSRRPLCNLTMADQGPCCDLCVRWKLLVVETMQSGCNVSKRSQQGPRSVLARLQRNRRSRCDQISQSQVFEHVQPDFRTCSKTWLRLICSQASPGEVGDQSPIMEGDLGHNSIMPTGNSNAILCLFMYHYYMLCHFIQ